MDKTANLYIIADSDSPSGGGVSIIESPSPPPQHVCKFRCGLEEKALSRYAILSFIVDDTHSDDMQILKFIQLQLVNWNIPVVS